MNVYVCVLVASIGACDQSLMNQLNGIDWKETNRVVQFSFALNAQFPLQIEICAFFKSLVEVSDFLVRLPLNADQISSRLNHTVIYLETPQVFESILSDSSGHFLQYLSLLRLVSSHAKRLANNQGLFKTACAVSYRYKSSTLSSVETQWDLYANKSVFFPISSRIRDISITRDRCVEDSTMSILSILRSLKQLVPDSINGIAAFASDILRSQIGVTRLFGLKQPLTDLIFAVSIASSPSLEYAHPMRKFPRRSSSPIFGFDCNKENACEVESVVNSFISARESTDVNREFRSEFQFLQSVNANWLHALSLGWGNRITSALLGLARRNKSPVNIRCREDAVQGFLDMYSASALGEKVVFAISNLMKVPTDCSIALSALTAIIMDVLVQSNGVSARVYDAIREEDIGELLEISWQTIAGERFDVLLSTPVPLFALMNLTWSRMLGNA